MTGIFSDRRLIGCIAGVNRRWKSGVEDVGFIKWLIVHPHFRRQGFGRTLLQSIQGNFTDLGMRELRFGGSAPYYLLTGAPADEIALRQLLTSEDWQLSSERVNLYADCTELAITEHAIPGCSIIEVKRDKSRPVLDFIEREFSVSWAFESENVYKNTNAGFLLACYNDRKEPVGFVAIGATNRNWFGPMGVAESGRGKGLGRVLLTQALLLAKNRGIANLCIPWAEENFYRHILGNLPRTLFIKATRQL